MTSFDQPSVPVKPWSNIYDASKEGPGCPEPKGVLISEDCLTLNIYTNYVSIIDMPAVYFMKR